MLLHLIDGSGYIFRAFYAVRPLSTRAGVPTNAVVGFARMLLRLIETERPTHLGIAFDRKEKTFRHTLFPAYKATRDKAPEELIAQIPLIHELVSALGIPTLYASGFEADDVLATLSRRATNAGHQALIVSGDKDLLQLVDEQTTVLDTMKDVRYDARAVRAKLGVDPVHVVDLLALAGDQSDNIPGVPRVGPKTAVKLVAEHGGLDDILKALTAQAQRSSLEDAVVAHRADALLCRTLAQLRTDVPVELDWEALSFGPPDPTRLSAYFERVEAPTLCREFLAAFGAAEATPTSAPRPAPVLDHARYQTIQDVPALSALISQITKTERCAVDLETTSLDPKDARIVGISLATDVVPPAYIPVGHSYEGVPTQLELTLVLEALRPLLENPRIQKYGQNLKYDYAVLRQSGVALSGIAGDSMLAAYVLDPTRASFGLEALSTQYINHQIIRFQDVVPKRHGTFRAVPVERATAYAAEDADVALRLCDKLGEEVTAQGMQELYVGIELPLLSVLARMENRGVRVDVSALTAFGRELSDRIQTIEVDVHGKVGRPINLSSPKQLAQLLFVELGLPAQKKTKTGFSTDQEVLEQLAQEHELPRRILDHRLLTKLKSTYVDSLPKMVHPQTGRVHTSFNQTGTATGRLSSSDPNLQNIPIRTEDGRRIRSAFVTEPGWSLISADYSQVELRVLAHLCGDPAFQQAFIDGEDIHRRTAQEVLGDTTGDPEARRRAKAINFGIVYGLSEYGLSRQLGIPNAEARAFIERYFGRYPGIRTFLDRTIEGARTRGFVTTMAGRKRYIGNIASQNRTLRQAAERIAMNTPIQGSAADLIKLAMLAVERRLERARLRARLLLQVHDELVLEAPEEETTDVAAMVREEMEGVAKLAVPLTVAVSWGKDWAAAHS